MGRCVKCIFFLLQNSPSVPICTYHQLLKRARDAAEGQSAWKMDSEIMEETNCTGPCSYFEYETELATELSSNLPKGWIYPNDTVAAVRLFYVDTATHISEEYWSYDGFSFFGEVGGAIGVFLGWSMLNLYQGLLEIMWNKLWMTKDRQTNKA